MAGTADGGDQPSRARRLATIALVVLAIFLTLLASVAMWLRSLVLDTNAYVRAIGPVLNDQQVRDALAEDVVNQLYERVDVTALLRESLPDKAASFAPTLAASIRDTSVRLASTALGTAAVQRVWRAANRLAHQQIVRVLEGKGKVVSTSNGEVAIETGPLAAQVRKALADNGIHVFDSVKTDTIQQRFVLFRSTDLQHLQLATRLLDELGTWLPVLTGATIAAAIICSTQRRRTIEYLALGIATMMVLIVVAAAVGRSFYLGAVGHAIAQPIAAAPFDALVAPLRAGARLVFIGALVVWAAAWLSGSRTALAREQRARTVVLDGLHQYARPLAIAGGVVAAVVLVAWDRPHPLTVVAIFGLLAAWEALMAASARRVSAG